MEPGVTVLGCNSFGEGDVIYSVVLCTTLGFGFALLSIFDAYRAAQESATLAPMQ